MLKSRLELKEEESENIKEIIQSEKVGETGKKKKWTESQWPVRQLSKGLTEI